MRPRIVLASASLSRQRMLCAAAVEFTTDPSSIDEAEVKRSMASAPVAEIAIALAKRKAEDVAPRHPDALVIGSDQILACDGRLFDKPRDRAEARQQLIALRGREHSLTSAIAVVQGDNCIWAYAEEARLAMRAFSEAFLDGYLDRAGDSVLSSVGAYQIEGPGAQLFDSVAGDMFTIMGMPLIPLLAFLRRQGVIAA